MVMRMTRKALERLRRPASSAPDPLAMPSPPERGSVRKVRVRPPGSKSLTNRALPLAALAEGRSTLRGALTDGVDARRMIESLRALGASIEEADSGSLTVDGVGGAFPKGGELFLENAGTATRFLTGLACLAREAVTIDGNERMRQRPIGELVELLRGLGVSVTEQGEAGFVPLRIEPGRPAGGELEVPTTLSSQYVSALLLLAPWTEQGIDLRLTSAPTSPSYVEMTLGLLERLGAKGVEREGDPLRRVAVGAVVRPAADDLDLGGRDPHPGQIGEAEDGQARRQPRGVDAALDPEAEGHRIAGGVRRGRWRPGGDDAVPARGHQRRLLARGPGHAETTLGPLRLGESEPALGGAAGIDSLGLETPR